VDAKHIVICKNVSRRNKPFIERKRRKTTKKEKNNCIKWVNFKVFFLLKIPSKRVDVPQKEFLEDFGLLIIKNNLPIQFVESMWLKNLILHLCPKLNFLSKRQFSQEILPGLVEKTSQQYVLLTLAYCFSVIVSYDI
jgi:hypothetical protein